MEFKIQSKKFKKIISMVSRICGGNLTLPILNNILIEAKDNNLSFFSTNLEIGIVVNTQIEIKKEGKISVPGKILSDFLSYLPDEEVEVKLENFILNLKCANFQARILGQDPKDFPVVPEIKEKNSVKLDNIILTKSLPKIYHIVSPNDSRVEISGILFSFKKDKLFICGTDSIRLAEKNIDIKEVPENILNKSLIIPQRTAVEISNIFSEIEGEMEIIFDQSQISFNLTPSEKTEPKISLISRLIEGSFPDYKEIIPKSFKTEALFLKDEILNKVKTTSIFSSKIQDIKLDFNQKSKKLTISASSSNIGEAKSIVKGDIKGQDIEVNVNWKYLLDGISVIDSSEIIIGLNDNISPIMIMPVGDKSYFYILMPKTM
jgi:DNA polymerase-3 subunit beta